MKRSWTALAVAFVAMFAAAACSGTGTTFQQNTGAQITQLSPANINQGSPDFTLTVNSLGGFVTGTVVQWNNKKLTTTFVNVSTVTATVPAALVAKLGTAYVNTLNPHTSSQNNGLSNTLAFIINPPPNPVPSITSMNPNSAANGGASFTLTITGSSFLPTSDPSGGSIVQWNAGGKQYTSAPQAQPNPPSVCSDPAYITVSSISATQIVANISHCLIAAQGTAIVTVYNPPAPPPPGCLSNCGAGGGGTSPGGLLFTIDPPPAAAAHSASATAQIVSQETPTVSLDGRFVAYTAEQNSRTQVFLRDTCTGADAACKPSTTLLSAAPDGAAANGDSHTPSMSADGRYIAFSSAATNLVADAPAGHQVYLRDTCFGAAAACVTSTQLVSVDDHGALLGAENILPSLSSSGRFVAFLAVTPSHAANSSAAQAKPDTSAPNSGYRQVFVRDTCLGAANCTPKTTRISLQPGDAPADGASPAGPALSGGAKHVAIAGGDTATLFTRSVAVDDRVFLAITKDQQ
jgi:hypothetical protein